MVLGSRHDPGATARVLMLGAWLALVSVGTAAAQCVPADCDDGDACTFDACDTSGPTPVCAHGNACDDGNPCTSDVCDSSGPAIVCNHGQLTGPCDDGSACTTGDTCTGGQCVGTPVAPCCGNGTLEPGETCDPPDPTPVPATGQATCRADCTRCGDGVVQASAGESCDDANTVSGCNPAKPAQPLDACQNNCTQPICADPSKIVLTTPADSFTSHGRLIVADTVPDPTTRPFLLELTSSAGLIYSAQLPIGSITSDGKAYKYSNPAASMGTGISSLKIVPKVGHEKLTVKAYGHLTHATADMTTHVHIGTTEWTLRGVWDRTRKGWRLTGHSPLLQP